MRKFKAEEVNELIRQMRNGEFVDDCDKMCYELFQCDESCLGFGLCPNTIDDDESEPVVINVKIENINITIN